MTNTGRTQRSQVPYSLWKICVGSILEPVPQKRDKHSRPPPEPYKPSVRRVSIAPACYKGLQALLTYIWHMMALNPGPYIGLALPQLSAMLGAPPYDHTYRAVATKSPVPHKH